MTAILITATLAGFSLGLLLGSTIAAGSAADLRTRILRLEYHLARIIHRYHNTQLNNTTIEEAEKALADKSA